MAVDELLESAACSGGMGLTGGPGRFKPIAMIDLEKARVRQEYSPVAKPLHGLGNPHRIEGGAVGSLRKKSNCSLVHALRQVQRTGWNRRGCILIWIVVGRDSWKRSYGK
jgi:hypothetical protein